MTVDKVKNLIKEIEKDIAIENRMIAEDKFTYTSHIRSLLSHREHILKKLYAIVESENQNVLIKQ